ncbi:cysteine ABC transporter substrate-binding protein [Viridibacillus sp. NPDC096237]|uniref:cysteine ABC transporter substrate-binding protein n=1 Tax=Viridibacillus sp. NPDC096237 TaxID=3390721 RepID=UPI003CFCFB95
MTKKFKKNVFALITLSILVLALTACGNDNSSDDKGKTSSIDAIKERGKVRIAVFSDKPPFGYIDENGKNQGYDILLAKRIAKDLLGDESKVEFILTEAQNRVDVLKSDKVDITLANFTVTPERSEQVDFANPYMKVAIGVASPKKAAISDVQQLDGKKLLINKGTTAETYFAKNYVDIEQVKYDQNTETFEALKDGRGAALAHDNTLLYAWVKENPDYVVDIKSIGDLDYIAPAVKKSNKELLDWLNEELETLGKEQFFHKAFDEVLRPVYGENVKADDVVVEGKSK